MPGAAHPNTMKWGANYLITGKTVRQLMLKDIFDTNKNFLPVLIYSIKYKLSAQYGLNGNDFIDVSLEGDALSRYVICPRRITFYFDMSTTHTSLDITIFLDELAGILKHDSVIQNMWK